MKQQEMEQQEIQLRRIKLRVQSFKYKLIYEFKMKMRLKFVQNSRWDPWFDNLLIKTIINIYSKSWFFRHKLACIEDKKK